MGAQDARPLPFVPVGDGDYLFHYTTSDAAFGSILPEQELQFSPYERMRDPLENKKWWFSAMAFGEAEYDRERADQALAAFHRNANEIRESAKLLSLTISAPYEDERDKVLAQGWARARMWEHYADRHAGVCLVFDKAKLTKAVVGSLESRGVAGPYHHPVRYPARRFEALPPYLDFRTLHENSSPEAVRKWVQRYHDGLFFQKTPDWETEHEYRFVATWSEDVYLYADIGDALDAVIVGEKFPSWQLPAAVTASQRAGAKCRLVNWSMGSPRLFSLDEAFATQTP